VVPGVEVRQVERLDRIKDRLSGTNKAKKEESGKAGEASVMQQDRSDQEPLAQMLVDKYKLGPKIGRVFWSRRECAGRRRGWCTPASGFAGRVVAWLDAADLPRLVSIAGGRWWPARRPSCYRVRKRKARLHRFEELFPDALEFVSRSMRAGHAFSVSLEMIHREFQEPVAGEFRRTFEEHNLGLPIEIALQKLAKRVPSLDVHFFVSAVLLQKRTGGNLAEILDKLAYVIRERFKLRGASAPSARTDA
jgi:Flp pilus assembly protein TadB